MTVIIIGDRIQGIAHSETIRPPKDAETVDATGKFLIPGLWDMHVHWYDKDYLPLFIANGVTGVRQMFGTPEHYQWRKEIEAGQRLGPHMLIASPIVDGPKRAGVPIPAGTDTLNPFCFPGFSLHDELELLVQSGPYSDASSAGDYIPSGAFSGEGSWHNC